VLGNEDCEVTAVGDYRQSIYSFRGSDLKYFLKFKNYFPHSHIHNLSINYRSHSEIINCASKFISHNPFQRKDRFIAHKGPGGSVKGYKVKNYNDENKTIIKLLDTINHRGTTAILYRNNYQRDIINKECFCEDNDTIKMMTIHASKGLEFDTIIICGLSDSILPDRMSNIEEERRLLYIAITRAKKNCIIIAHENANGSLPLFARELSLSFKEFDTI